MKDQITKNIADQFKRLKSQVLGTQQEEVQAEVAEQQDQAVAVEEEVVEQALDESTQVAQKVCALVSCDKRVTAVVMGGGFYRAIFMMAKFA